MNRIFDREICLFFSSLFVCIWVLYVCVRVYERIQERREWRRKEIFAYGKKGINLVIQVNSIKCFNRQLAFLFAACLLNGILSNYPMILLSICKIRWNSQNERCSAISVRVEHFSCNSQQFRNINDIIWIIQYLAGTMHHLCSLMFAYMWS